MMAMDGDLKVGDVVPWEADIMDALRVAENNRKAMSKAFAVGIPYWARWFLVQVRTGGEEAAVDELELAGVETWLPTVLVPKTGRRRGGQWRGRYDLVSELALPGFVAVKLVPSGQAWCGLMAVESVLHVMVRDVQDWASDSYKTRVSSALTKKDVHRLELMAEQIFGDLDSDQPALFVGDKVKVKDGPFQGFQGFIDPKPTQEHHHVVELDVFGRATPIHFHVDQLIKLD